jgi:homoserine O-acetyltransferase
MHGFGANHHAGDHLIGPGKPLDSDKYFIICSDELGNTQTGFEHSTSPTNSGLKMNFPLYKPRDKVKAEHKLVTQGLGIPHLLAVTGISTGADNSVQMAVSYPGFMDGIFPISGGAIWTSQGFFQGPLMTSIIESCAGWNGGNYDQNPKACGANALSTIVPLFYTREWWNQYIDVPEAYTKWRNTQGDYYLDVQDARDLYYRNLAESRGWVGDTPGFNEDLTAILHSIKAKTLFIANPHDQWFRPQDIETQVRAIPDARVVWIDSVAGHFIAQNADPNATRVMVEAIRAFLRELSAQRSSGR